MYCPHCGAEVSDDSLFCENCGKKIEEADVTGDFDERNETDSIHREYKNRNHKYRQEYVESEEPGNAGFRGEYWEESYQEKRERSRRMILVSCIIAFSVMLVVCSVFIIHRMFASGGKKVRSGQKVNRYQKLRQEVY